MAASRPSVARLFLSGDVFPGRGIDQLLPTPVPAEIHESFCRSALDYVKLAEDKLGRRLPRGVKPGYIWGIGLRTLDALRPDARVINLETAVTTSDDWVNKGINYRMHPRNAEGFLKAAGIDAVALANNHVLDWGYAGLGETLASVRAAGVAPCGAGIGAAEAEAPAVVELEGGGRLLVFSAADISSGVPKAWEALPPGPAHPRGRPGVAMVPVHRANASQVAEEVRRVKEMVELHRQPGVLVIFSVHWAGNWDYAVPDAARAFARGLVTAAHVDLVHGHSSHHAKGMEVHNGHLILYGCGDLLNDYEGISNLGEERYRGDLGAMYFPTLDIATGRLTRLLMAPTTVRAFRIEGAGMEGARWLQAMVAREGARLGGRASDPRCCCDILTPGSPSYPVAEDLGPLLDLRWDAEAGP